MNLLIFLDLSYNQCKNFKFYSLQGQSVQIFLIFTYNQGKIFLIYLLLGGGGGSMYTWSPLGVALPLRGDTEENRPNSSSDGESTDDCVDDAD